MCKQKIGFSLKNSYDIPTVDVIKMLKETGFDAVSPTWADMPTLEQIVSAAKENNLEIQFLHAPFGKAKDMWSFDEQLSYEAKKSLLEPLEACKKFNIPIMVVHVWIGYDYSFEPENLNFKNFDEVVDEATRYGIKIAFENTEGGEYLFALMNRYKGNDTVGLCWDSGHEMCYNYSEDILTPFADRLMVTHLNDNFGIRYTYDGKNDLHLLPYDGIADWDYNIMRLKNSKPLDILNFELRITSFPERPETHLYDNMDFADYLKEAYKRACKIAYKYSE